MQSVQIAINLALGLYIILGSKVIGFDIVVWRLFAFVHTSTHTKYARAYKGTPPPNHPHQVHRAQCSRYIVAVSFVWPNKLRLNMGSMNDKHHFWVCWVKYAIDRGNMRMRSRPKCAFWSHKKSHFRGEYILKASRIYFFNAEATP